MEAALKNEPQAIAPEDYYKAIVGPKNQAYYLDKFGQFERKGAAGTSWNWSAFFFTFYWLLYRKQWRSALIYFLLPYLLLIPLGIVAAISGLKGEKIIGFGQIGYGVLTLIVPPMFANAWYYRHCKEKIAKTQATGHSREWQLGELTGKGGTSNVMLIIIGLMSFVAIFGILAAIAIPTYQDYVTKAKVAAGLEYGEQAAQAVGYFYEHHKRVPDSLEDAGFDIAMPQGVQALKLDSNNGVISIEMAPYPVRNQAMLLVPSLDINNHVTWQCGSKDMAQRFLPLKCRQSQH